MSPVKAWPWWAQPLLMVCLLVLMPLVLVVDEVIPALILRSRRRWSGRADQ